MISEIINQEYNIIHKSYSGKLTFEELFEETQKMLQNSSPTGCQKVLASFENASLQLIPQDTEQFVQLLKSSKLRGPRNIAIVVTTPASTALAFIFKMTQISKYNIEVFCTDEGAMDWLLELP